jgi:Alkylmercury lyase
MLLFRSEETVEGWCREHGVPRRPILSVEQLWSLAVAWYENRLTVDSRRPGPEEMVGIFSRIGLEGPFWDPSRPE